LDSVCQTCALLIAPFRLPDQYHLTTLRRDHA
jgi:hypothetical protein